MEQLGLHRLLKRVAFANKGPCIVAGQKLYYSKTSNVQTTNTSNIGGNSKKLSGDKFTADLHRVTDHTGTMLNENCEPNTPEEFAVALYKKMVQLYVMNRTLMEVQHQGRISFNMTHYGKEVSIGSTAAYAIPRSTIEQYWGNGTASSGVGYGMNTIRVNTNDVWAVYNAINIAVNEKWPIMIESMTYSNSDDSTKYRVQKEVDDRYLMDNNVTPFRRYLEQKQWWNQEQEDAWIKLVKQNILKSVAAAEKRKESYLDYMFADAYDEIPVHLIQQQEELTRLIEEYPDYFSTKDYFPSLSSS